MRNKGTTMGAVVCALCGIAGLFAATHLTHPSLGPVSSITEPGSYVACEGIILETYQTKGHTLVTLYDGSPILVPLFNFAGDISVGDLLYAEGVVSVYKGNLEVIPEEYSISKVLYGRCCNSVLYTEHGRFRTQLPDGDYAVLGTTDDGQLFPERILEIPLIPMEGRICTISTGSSTSTFLLYADHRIFVSSHPLAPGSVKGFGIQDGTKVLVLYHTWEPLSVDSINLARKMPIDYPVTVSGIIKSVTASKGHIFIVIEDATGFILVPIFSTMQSQLKVDSNTFHEGQSLTVTGTIHVYGGIVELLPVAIHG